MSSFTIQDKPFNLPNSSSGFTTDQSQHWPLSNLMLMPLVFVENTGVTLIQKFLWPQLDNLLRCCRRSQSLQLYNTIFQIIKLNLKMAGTILGTLTQLLWSVATRTLGRQIGVLQQFRALDGLNPSPTLTPAILPFTVSWPCPQSPSYVPCYLVYPTFTCCFKNFHVK